MINLADFENCKCIARANPHNLCDGALTFEENGIKVTLKTGKKENAVALAIDGCVCKDQQLLKCDGLFLLQKERKGWVILVELKGGNFEQAFAQLSYMKMKRKEYVSIVELFNRNGMLKANEYAFVVSNHRLSKPEHQKLEKHYGIRVRSILHSEATTPIPDIRKHL